MRRLRHPAVATVVFVALFASTLMPATVGAPPTVPGAPHTSPAAPAASGATGTSHVSPAVARPAITCPPTPPPSPAFATVPGSGAANLFPPTPILADQVPCDLVDEDEVHGNLGSNIAYSGERFTVPLTLPADTLNATEAEAYFQIAIGLVVAGDPNSAWGQSWAEIAFTPLGATWEADVAVWALINDSYHGGSTTENAPVCPGNSNFLSWNYSYFCEELQIASTDIGAITSGDHVTVTFAGVKGGSSGLDLWVNDSTNSADSTSFVFSATNTGNHTYEPFYNSSCVDLCLLQWSFPLGQSFLAFPASYSETILRALDPVEIGVPHFWSATAKAYAGEYPYFSAESTSGVCNSGAPPGTVAPCTNFLVAGGTGYYPYFSFNGSELNFGANYSWTTDNFAGATSELHSTATQNDLSVFFFWYTENSSRAGFSPGLVPITVTANVQDLGTVSTVSLSYALDAGSYTTIPMTLGSGTTTNGTWSAVIPSTIGNGTVAYYITAVNNAAVTTHAPYAGAFYIQRGPLPTFQLQLTTDLLSCGGDSFNGTIYANGTTVATLPGFYPLRAVGCYPYVFHQWTRTGGAQTANLAPLAVNLTVNANGTVQAHWDYVRPNDTVNVTTSPSTCGSVTIGGSTVSNGASVQLPDALPVSLTETTCAGKLFSGWTLAGNFTILGTSFTPYGNGTLTANYVSTTGALALDFDTDPSTCGGILFRGAGYTNGESLSVQPGTYAIAPDPCAHWGFTSFTVSDSSALQIASGNLTISGPGTVTEHNFRLTEITFVIEPSSCGWAIFDGTVFHSGAVVVVDNNSVHSIYAQNTSACHLIALTGDGGVHVTGNVAVVNGSGNITASFGAGPATQTIVFLTDPSTCGAIVFNNIAYLNSNFTSVQEGLSFTITAQPCAGYGFVTWLTYGEVTVVGSTAYVNSSGAIEAVFRPLVSIILLTDPIGCGTITIAGGTYPSNRSVEVPEANSYPIVAHPCAGYAFVGWENTTGLSVENGTLYVLGPGFLTADFSPIVYSVAVLLSPSDCGSVKLNGTAYGNGSVATLAAGNYPIAASPCLGDHLDHWTTADNVSVNGSTLEVNGSGSVLANFAPTPPSVTLSLPGSTLVGSDVEIYATVGVLIPPFNYTYRWSFGDGTPVVTTPANFTAHAYGRSGTFTVTVTVTDPLGRTANASARIQALAGSATSSIQVSAFALTAVGIAAVVLLAFAVLALARRRGDDGAPIARRPRRAVEPTPPPGEEPKP